MLTIHGSSVILIILTAAKFEADDEEFDQQIKRQKYGPTSELTTKTDFPVQAWQPKVQTPYYVPPGQTPRRVEIERYYQICQYTCVLSQIIFTCCKSFER